MNIITKLQLLALKYAGTPHPYVTSLFEKRSAPQLQSMRQAYPQHALPEQSSPTREQMLAMDNQMRSKSLLERSRYEKATAPKTPSSDGSYQDFLMNYGEMVGNLGYFVSPAVGVFASRVGRGAAGTVGGVGDAMTGKASKTHFVERIK